MSYNTSSPTSTSSSGGLHKAIPPGFLPFSRPQQKRLDQLSHRELLDRYAQNKNILNQPIPSTSSHHQRVMTEQAAIEEILGMEALREGMARTHISEPDDPMDTTESSPPPAPPSRTLETKRRLIERYYGGVTKQKGATKALGLSEAMAIEQQATLAAMERKKQEEERRRQYSLPRPEELLTREEREARIWAYMNAKPTESDEEDEDWNEDDEDVDPSRWFEFDEDDGRQGQPLIDPDEIADIIRVEERHWNE